MIRLTDKLRHARMFDNDDGAGGGAAVIDPPADTAQIPADDAASLVPATPAAPVEPTDEQIQEALNRRGQVAIPANEAQRIAVQRQEAEATAKANADAERAALLYTDPAEYDRRLRNDLRGEAVAEARALAQLPVQIMADVRKAVPGLPEAEYEQMARTLADPSVTVDQLRQAAQAGVLTNFAKSRKLELLEKGEITLRPGQRAANDAAPAPGAPPKNVMAPEKASQLETMAKTLGVSVDDLKQSQYYTGR